MFNVIKKHKMAMEDTTICLFLSFIAAPVGETSVAYVMVTMSRNFVKAAFYEAVTPRLAY